MRPAHYTRNRPRNSCWKVTVPLGSSQHTLRGHGAHMADLVKEIFGSKATKPKDAPVKPSATAAITSIATTLIALAVATLIDAGEPFKARVETVDALAGLAIGAFIVDRLLTFVPPGKAARKENAPQRSADIAFLRIGYGAVLGATFVVLTDLRAVRALTPESPEVVSAGVDRAIAVLAIAGGVAGLARLLSAINPQPETQKPAGATPGTPATSGTPATPATAPAPATSAGPPSPTSPGSALPSGPAATTASGPGGPADPTAETEKLPSPEAYVLGAVALVATALLASTAIGDETGLELLGSPPKTEAAAVAGGSVALVVRFGPVILAAAIVEQIVERFVSPFALVKANRSLVTGAVALILGVVAARLIDLFLLHNLGFFGATAGPINTALSSSSGLERWADALLTGIVIAAGTKPIHELSSRLRKAK